MCFINYKTLSEDKASSSTFASLVEGGKSTLRIKKSSFWDFPGGPVVKTLPSMQGVQVQSLVTELRSHMRAAKKPKHKTEAIL